MPTVDGFDVWKITSSLISSKAVPFLDCRRLTIESCVCGWLCLKATLRVFGRLAVTYMDFEEMDSLHKLLKRDRQSSRLHGYGCTEVSMSISVHWDFERKIVPRVPVESPPESAR